MSHLFKITGMTAVAALALLFSGCASYHLGSSAELPFKSIYVRPAANEGFAPQAQSVLSGQIREAFIRDGRLQLVADEAEADAVLEVTITDYSRSSAVRDSGDTVRATDFDLRLEASASLYDNAGGRYFFKGRQVSERGAAYVGNPYSAAIGDAQGFSQAEYQAMPRLTRGLARKIADEVLGAW